MRIVLLRFDIDGFVVIRGIDVDRQVQASADWRARSRRCGPSSTASACARRCGRRGKCCRPCRFRRRNKAPACRAARTASAFISSMRGRSLSSSGARRRRMPRLMRVSRSRRVDAVHVVALFVGDHLQRQLVMVAQEQRPLAVFGDGRRLLQNVHDGDSGPPCAAP